MNHQLVEAEVPATAAPPPQAGVKKTLVPELRLQGRIALPLSAMNLACLGKYGITTVFLGRLGELELAGGTLGFTFANVTGFSVLTGLCAGMEPICGQSFGAGNYKLLHKTLLMTTVLLLAASLPIALLWLNVDWVLVRVGQQRDIAGVGRKYLLCLMPELAVVSFLYPLKSYLNSQGVTLPTMFASAGALAFHVPLNVLLSRARGIEGVAMAIWITDLSVVIMLGAYVAATERGRRGGNAKGEAAAEEEGEVGGRRRWWWEQSLGEWRTLLRLSAPCCLTTCLEWWCYEILVLLTGRLPDARRMVSIIAVVFNFDYLLYAGMCSVATCASVRVSNELGAGNPGAARLAAYVSLGVSAAAGVLGAAAMVGLRGVWGRLFSREETIVEGVKRTLLVMAVVEVVNFPLGACGGIVRGTARPWLGMYASLGGFYLVALPMAVALGFTARMGLVGMLLSFLVGAVTSTVLLMMAVAWIDWDEEARNAKDLAGKTPEEQLATPEIAAA